MRILVLHAHPRPSASIAMKALLEAARAVQGVTVHDLYAAYPDFGIDAASEQKLLLEHDAIVFQHPFYWYSSPAIIKEWQDIVLDFGWAYGTGGNKLHGKYLMTTITTGGAADYYHPKGRNRHSIEQFLAPFNQTAYLCGMAYLKPFVVFEGRRLSSEDLLRRAQSYHDLLTGLASGSLDPMKMLAHGFEPPPTFVEARP